MGVQGRGHGERGMKDEERKTTSKEIMKTMQMIAVEREIRWQEIELSREIAEMEENMMRKQ